MEESLRRGFNLSLAVLSDRTFDEGQFSVLVPADFDREPMNLAAGGVAGPGFAKRALGDFLDESTSRGAASAVVEDDMMRASDPAVANEVEALAYCGERVLHWCDLRDGRNACAHTVITGAHGYPLNAFLTRRTPGELGLADRQETREDLPDLIVESLIAVVVAAFDTESFLIWMR